VPLFTLFHSHSLLSIIGGICLPFNFLSEPVGRCDGESFAFTHVTLQLLFIVVVDVLTIIVTVLTVGSLPN